MTIVDENSQAAWTGRLIAAGTLIIGTIGISVSASNDVVALLDDSDRYLAEGGALTVFWTVGIALGVGFLWGIHNCFLPSRRFGAGVVCLVAYGIISAVAVWLLSVPLWAAIWAGLAFVGAVVEDYCVRERRVSR